MQISAHKGKGVYHKNFDKDFLFESDIVKRSLCNFTDFTDRFKCNWFIIHESTVPDASYLSRFIMDAEDFLDFDQLDNQIQSIIDHSELQSNLKIQLGETDVLRAMYYQAKEFVIDESVLQKVNDYVFGDSQDVPPTIDFSINLAIDDMLIETHVILPKSYPNIPPKVYARSNQLKRNEQEALNCNLDAYLQLLDRGTICIYEGISWLTENVSKYCLKDEKNTSEEPPPMKSLPCVFTRYWIYSHHIYSKDKRRDLLALSRTCNVTGFCLSGKPGIICAEGLESDCTEWWQKVSRTIVLLPVLSYCFIVDEIKARLSYFPVHFSNVEVIAIHIDPREKLSRRKIVFTLLARR